MNPNPRTSLAETEVVKILYLKQIANQTLDGFNNMPQITRVSINEAQNVPTQITILLINMPKVITLKTTKTHGPPKQPYKKKPITCADSSIISVEIPTKSMGPSINDDMSM